MTYLDVVCLLSVLSIIAHVFSFVAISCLMTDGKRLDKYIGDLYTQLRKSDRHIRSLQRNATEQLGSLQDWAMRDD